MKKNFYEVTFVVNPVLEEDQVSQVRETFLSFINERGAEVDEVDEWGIRRLAYEIDGKNSGYYLNIYYTAPGSHVTELERFFKLQEDIMRHIILKYDNKMIRYRELKKKGKVPAVFSETPEEE